MGFVWEPTTKRGFSPRPGRRSRQTAQARSRLLGTLPDRAVMEVIAVVIGQTLASGSGRRRSGRRRNRDRHGPPLTGRRCLLRGAVRHGRADPDRRLGSRRTRRGDRVARSRGGERRGRRQGRGRNPARARSRDSGAGDGGTPPVLWRKRPKIRPGVACLPACLVRSIIAYGILSWSAGGKAVGNCQTPARVARMIKLANDAGGKRNHEYARLLQCFRRSL